jgi:ATP-dependent DNA helicase RecQ
LEAVAASADPAAGSAPTPVAAPSDRLAAARAALRESAARAGRPARRPTPRHWPEPDESLRRALLGWRLDVARSTGVPPYVLLHDVTVEALAALRPATMDELLAVPGFGAVKAARYGPVLLDIVGVRQQSA